MTPTQAFAALFAIPFIIEALAAAFGVLLRHFSIRGRRGDVE